MTLVNCFLIRWLKPEPPLYNLWIQKVQELHEMEQNITGEKAPKAQIYKDVEAKQCSLF